jgi:adenylate cyclase class IV
MLEFELRFKLEKDILPELVELGFRKRDELRMADLIFEPRSWKPGDMIIPGYHIVRVRLVHGKRPRLEIKEFVHGYKWSETAFFIEGPSHFVRLLSKLMDPRRVIEKKRETWVNGALEVCFDDVKHLGKFVEIEGPELEAKELALRLGFGLDDHQATYGSQLFYLQKTGMICFSPHEMQAILKEFS